MRKTTYIYVVLYCSHRVGAAIEVSNHRIPSVFSQLAFNPLCAFIYQNSSQSPDTGDVSESRVRLIIVITTAEENIYSTGCTVGGRRMKGE